MSAGNGDLAVTAALVDPGSTGPALDFPIASSGAALSLVAGFDTVLDAAQPERGEEYAWNRERVLCGREGMCSSGSQCGMHAGRMVCSTQLILHQRRPAALFFPCSSWQLVRPPSTALPTHHGNAVP